MITKMKIRNPDKPVRTSQESLIGFEKEGGYIATYKYDGWRCIVDYDGETVEFFSRRETERGGPTILPVSHSLKEETLNFFKENKLPTNTRLDSEWLSRRTEGPEKIIVFGIQYLNGQWLGSEPEDLRWTIVKSLNYNQPHVQLVEWTKSNFIEFFNKIKEKNINLPEGKQNVEGIVLKRLNSGMLGNIKTCKKNPGWFKIKWRDGASGYSPTF